MQWPVPDRPLSDERGQSELLDGPALASLSWHDSGRDYLCRSPNRAKRMECVQLAAAFDCGRTFEWALTRRKRQQAARTPYASRGSVTDTNNSTRTTFAVLTIFR